MSVNGRTKDPDHLLPYRESLLEQWFHSHEQCQLDSCFGSQYCRNNWISALAKCTVAVLLCSWTSWKQPNIYMSEIYCSDCTAFLGTVVLDQGGEAKNLIHVQRRTFQEQNYVCLDNAQICQKLSHLLSLRNKLCWSAAARDSKDNLARSHFPEMCSRVGDLSTSDGDRAYRRNYMLKCMLQKPLGSRHGR